MPMIMRDFHTALKSELLSKLNDGRVDIALARLQWGKNDIGYSLHVNPVQFTTSGLEFTDFLQYLGFQSGACSFTGFRRCFAKWVDEGFDIQAFLRRL